MPTLLALAQSIEADVNAGGYNTEYTNVAICRPNMGAPLGAGNLPYLTALNAGESASIGIDVSAIYAVLLLSPTGPYQVQTLQTINNHGDAASYQLDVSANAALQGYKKRYHPFGTEFDSLWDAIANHFRTVRVVADLERVSIVAPGTPVVGFVNGVRLVGDGRTTIDAFREQWYFEASYPWGTAGNIRSWRI